MFLIWKLSRRLELGLVIGSVFGMVVRNPQVYHMLPLSLEIRRSDGDELTISQVDRSALFCMQYILQSTDNCHHTLKICFKIIKK